MRGTVACCIFKGKTGASFSSPNSAREYVFVIFKVYDLCRRVCDESIGRCHEVALVLVNEVKRTKGCKVLAKSFQS